MDFESVNPAIPRFPGTHPYDQLPFQWSVQLLREPGAEVEHHEFLATDASDPRREFIASLSSVIGGRGSIVVYYQPFEEKPPPARNARVSIHFYSALRFSTKVCCSFRR